MASPTAAAPSTPPPRRITSSPAYLSDAEAPSPETSAPSPVTSIFEPVDHIAQRRRRGGCRSHRSPSCPRSRAARLPRGSRLRRSNPWSHGCHCRRCPRRSRCRGSRGHARCGPVGPPSCRRWAMGAASTKGTLRRQLSSGASATTQPAQSDPAACAMHRKWPGCTGLKQPL